MPPKLIKKLKLYINLTKPPKRENIYKFCLYMHVRRSYRLSIYIPTCSKAPALFKFKPLFHYTESIKRDDVETFC